MIDLSVIIPTCNRPQLLRRACASVVAQNDAPAFECIVADDGEQGAAGEVRQIAEAFGARYCYIGGNRGGAAARNRGAGLAQGALLAFLDDDDAWETAKLATQVPLMHDSGVVMSYTGLTIVHRNGHRRYSFRKPPYTDLDRSIMRDNFIGTTSSVVVRRSSFEAVGGFDEALPALQDYDLYIRLLRKGQLNWTPLPLTVYYSGEAGRNVSASLDRFRRTAGYLLDKYRDDPNLLLLRKSLKHITLLKCVRSNRFLIDYLRALPGRFLRSRP